MLNNNNSFHSRNKERLKLLLQNLRRLDLFKTKYKTLFINKYRNNRNLY